MYGDFFYFLSKKATLFLLLQFQCIEMIAESAHIATQKKMFESEPLRRAMAYTHGLHHAIPHIAK